ncbi:hypothetical protein P5673_011694 [Acropora cervicornis]|uniref:Uncharacterized protein n=1 Tax=Acropora cervicornis TaxID=6130 RepID=A0AAD9QPD9_ACRCE|nr:hypothetical protein P5673_011694 [Acropora cervicornis]
MNSSAMFALRLQRRHRRRCPVREKIAPFGYLALKISSCRHICTEVLELSFLWVFLQLLLVRVITGMVTFNSLANYRTDFRAEQNTRSFLCVRLNL